MEKTIDATIDVKWKNLIRLGGIAPLVTILFYFVEFSLVFIGEYPTTVEGWLLLFQRSKILGLLYLNVLDILSISLLGIMFLALYIVLRRRSESLMVIAAFLATLGVAMFVTTRSNLTSGTLSLCDQYTTAVTEAQRAQVMIAARAINTLGQPTLQTAGFIFLVGAVLIISYVMLRSNFGKATAWVGLLASAFTLIDDFCIVLLPSMTIPMMGIAGIFWIVWWILISRMLLRMSRSDARST
jgi:Domain of unknown function (DUF4386)